MQEHKKNAVETARVTLKGPALEQARAIKEELQLTTLSDAVSVMLSGRYNGSAQTQSTPTIQESERQPPGAMSF
ncbi:MAG: hypothetical protein F6K11_31315 [Leptolyngbya sp. SIO3F4]|nr:hypothetical protein [Leptolyngbya sp. SIO3F4]